MDDIPFVSCDVGVYKDKKMVLYLDVGVEGVYKFFQLATDGIEGAISVDKSFSYNVDVTILGFDLLKFISKEYHSKIEWAKEKLRDNEQYTIVCYDMS